MKLKELKKTVNVSWSPAERHPVALAAGSAAQQVDASFNSSAYLELYSLNLEDSGQDLELKSSLQTEHKFQKIVWSGANIIVGGCDGGLLQFYSVDKLLSGAPDALLGSNTKHSGNVSALDINPYQKNLLASGASDSEIFIWDLNNTSQPMAPGNRSQPADHVQGLAWNQQVQHILGSTFSSRCVVWDLRKNEPIMKLSDAQSRTRWRSLAWHPAVATQLCIASEDDGVPVIQLWDLRLAASPLATLEGHNKGVMSVSWCKQDPDLLLSAGKDGRVLCWNPNDTRPGGALLAELSQQSQWVFEVSWSRRCPALFATTSFDQQLSVHCLFGGSKAESSPQSASNIIDSFGGADSFSALPAVPRAAPPAPPQAQQLPTPPAWLKRPVAAKFSFGGKLVTFERCPQEAGKQKQVYISQVVSEPEIVEKATELDGVLEAAFSQTSDAAERLAQYCLERGDASSDQQERYTWFFLRASFLQHFKTEALNLLGFKQDDIPSKFKSQQNAGDSAQIEATGLSRGESTETEAELSTDTSTDLSEAQTLIERKLACIDLEPTASNVVIPNGDDAPSLICRALVCGNLEEAVELCLEAGRITDALVIASLGSQELVYKVQKYHLKLSAQDPVSVVTSSVLQARWDIMVSSASASSWKHTLAAILTHCEGEALAHYCELLGDKLSSEKEPSLSEAATICYLVGMSVERLVSVWRRPRARDVGALATLTTLALLANRAALQRGRQTQTGGKLESVLEEYAGRLASQGCLHSALRTLEGALQTELKDRLMYALGLSQPHRTQPQQPMNSRARTVSAHGKRHSHDNTYSNVPQNQYADQSWNQSSVPAQSPLQRGFQQPLQPQPLQPQPLQPPLQTQPPPMQQPPRPGSVGSQSGSKSGRSKYKVDPSVQSSPMYNNYNYSNPVTSQPSYGYNSPVPDHYTTGHNFAPINPANAGFNQPNAGFNQPNAGFNQPNAGFNQPNPGFNQPNAGFNQPNPGLAPLNPGLAPLNPGLNPLNPGVNPLNPGLNPVNPGLNPVNSAMNGSYYTPQPAEALPEAPLKVAAPGWNDPPMPSSKTKPKQEVVNQAPITHPLFGAEPPQHVPLNDQQYPGQQYPGQQYPTQQYPGQQYQGQQYPGQYDQQYQAPGYTQQPAEAPAPVAAPTPVPKGPLPDQHLVLQTVFDTVRSQCSERAANPQMKRKLEDVQRRLETMYDLLREYKLSESAVQSLHACAQHVQGRDYSSALDVTTALATGPDFAAAAAFLPGLKGLFQLAHQLQV